jgi:CubicO group peptidase (beta-lactamase class C family)
MSLVMILSLVVACTGPSIAPMPTATTVATAPRYWPTEGWRTATPEEHGIDSAQLARMFEYVQDNDVNLRSLLVIRNGYLVTEAYFDPYNEQTDHTLQSVTKTVIGMLIGIAIDKGFIKDVDQPLLDSFPDRAIANTDANKTSITLEHLLSLSAGLDCKDGAGTEEAMRGSSDWIQFMLDLPMAHQPGAEFSYCSGAVHLLSAVLQAATGMSAREFANMHLFAPLGIAAVPPERWDADPQSISIGGYGLYLTPRDMAKLGYLYLNQGRWEDQQIVSPGWVATSSTEHAVWTNEGIRPYGYLWWLYPEHGYYSAMGLGGQQIHVVPALNMVVVYTSAVNSPDEAHLATLLTDYILPAALSPAPLPASPDGVAQLDAHIQAVANPEQPVQPLPRIARRISGSEYTLGENPFGWKTLVFVFYQGRDTMAVNIDRAQRVTIRLDHLYGAQDAPETNQAQFRGHWEDENTFVVEQIWLGELVEYEFRLTFSGHELDIVAQERVFGGEAINVHGSRRS